METSREARVARIDRRRKRVMDKAKKRGLPSVVYYEEKMHHDPAFLIPVPMFTNAGACAATSGNIIDVQHTRLSVACRVGEEIKVDIPVVPRRVSSPVGNRVVSKRTSGGRRSTGGAPI